MRRVLIVGALLAPFLAGCGAFQGAPLVSAPPVASVPPVASPTAPGGAVPSPISLSSINVPKTVSVAEQTLILLDRAALRYVTLPVCGTTAAKLCADPVVKANIKAAAKKAFDAIMAARRNEALLGSALSAIDALRSLIPENYLS